jgi:signal transduction histidine kinase
VTVTHPEAREPVDREIKAAIAAQRPFVLDYTVAEALTNVDRYAGATHAIVRVRQDGDAVEVEVEIEDDGCGGADRKRGSGLRGLEDRLGTVGGVLEVASPPGGGTRLRVRVPLR